MKLSLTQKTSLSQILTPQQVQYLRLLQQPIVSLEQLVRQEIEENPFLDEELDYDLDDIETENRLQENKDDIGFNNDIEFNNNEEDIHFNTIDDFKLHRLEEGDNYSNYDGQWADDTDYSSGKNTNWDNDFEPFQIKNETTLYEKLLEQINLLYLNEEENLFALHIVGNIDDDGYIRRSLEDIIDETNSIIAEHNFNIQKQQFEETKIYKDNPAKRFEVSPQSMELLKEILSSMPEIQNDLTSAKELLVKYNNINSKEKIFAPINTEIAEKILKLIQGLEPAGIASRNVRECLIAQLEAKQLLNEEQQLALHILTDAFDEFSKKHFKQLQKIFDSTEEQIKYAFAEIKKLNPKPGGDDFIAQTNTIIPDFIIKYNDSNDELFVELNDTTIPNVKVSKMYEKMKNEARNNKTFNKETKDWIKEKFETAKFFTQALKQRNVTMLMVMTAIAHRQKNFFINDVRSLKPMIYKDIAEDTQLDISTVCRIVNGKYVSASTGIYELKFMFSESLPNIDGEDISTTVIKDKMQEIINNENKHKPFSDEQLVNLLKTEGYNVARRTIAKYRETMRIPVARLRKEI